MCPTPYVRGQLWVDFRAYKPICVSLLSTSSHIPLISAVDLLKRLLCPSKYFTYKTFNVFFNEHIPSVGTLVKRNSMSWLTIWSHEIEFSLINFVKWVEFFTFGVDLLAKWLSITTRKYVNGWGTETQLLTMGLKWIPSLVILDQVSVIH